MLNVLKKTAAVLLIFVSCFGLSQCAMAQRIDFPECLRRMERIYDTYELNFENSYFSEGEWFLFTDTLSESDVLITAREEEGGLLMSVGVSIINTGADGQDEVFISLCEAAVRAFTENADSEKILSDSRIYEEGVLFSDAVQISENGRFRTSLFNADAGSTFVVEIIR